MLNKKAIILCVICIFGILFDMNTGSCSANVETSLIYVESIWIGLDVTTEQKNQIDEIIGEAAHDVQNLQTRPITANMLDILEYESHLNDRRSIVNDKIMQVLSIEQQDVFNDQLRKQQQSQNLSTAALFNLDLSEKQDLLVIHSLMESQRQVWSIVSDKSLSWEARRKKLNRINIFKNLSSLLTKEQLNDLNLWSESLNLLHMNNYN